MYLRLCFAAFWLGAACSAPPGAPSSKAPSPTSAPASAAAQPTKKNTTTKPTSAQTAEVPERLWVYIGTYTESIYQYELELSSGELRLVGETKGLRKPSFLAIHPSQKFLYAADEVPAFEDLKTGAVSAFAIDPKTGALSPLNYQSSGGSGPCHVSVDHSGKNVLVANYSSGSVEVIPLKEDGSLAEPSSFVQEKGSSVNPIRQEGSHSHQISTDPKNKFALVPNLGADKLFVYQFDAEAGKLTEHEPPSVSVAPGSGPRHLAFHPSGRFVYLLNELKSTVVVLSFDAEKGALKELQTVSALPDKHRGGNVAAEVLVHPSGRFLYSSNRGHNSIAIFSIKEETGELALLGHEPTQGKTPRNFGVDPTGRYLIAANQWSDSLVLFAINQETGLLSATGVTVKTPKPACVKFVPVPK